MGTSDVKQARNWEMAQATSIGALDMVIWNAPGRNRRASYAFSPHRRFSLARRAGRFLRPAWCGRIPPSGYVAIDPCLHCRAAVLAARSFGARGPQSRPGLRRRLRSGDDVVVLRPLQAAGDSVDRHHGRVLRYTGRPYRNDEGVETVAPSAVDRRF